MTYKQIEAARELRLWLTQVALPVGLRWRVYLPTTTFVEELPRKLRVRANCLSLRFFTSKDQL